MNGLITVSGVRGRLDANGNPELNLEDVARGLGFTQVKNEVEYIRWETVDRYLRGFGFSQQVGKDAFIPENIFYKLCFKAESQTALAFQDKVTDEILPAIRKHGAYMTPETIEKVLLNPDTIISLATQLKAEQAQRRALEGKVEQDKPKVLFADAVAASHSSILVGELAKLLRQNGVQNMGQNRLFAWMRDGGYLIRRKGTDYNMPTQRSMELGLFEIKETAISKPNGSVSVSKTPKVTGKGQQYFLNLLLTDTATWAG